MNKSIDEIEEIERLVRDIRTPLGTVVGYEHEKYLDNKVIYYIKLGVSIEDLRRKAFEVAMSDFKRTGQYLNEPDKRPQIEQFYKRKYKQDTPSANRQ